MTEVQILALNRVKELGEESCIIFQKLVNWDVKDIPDLERTKMKDKGYKNFTQINEWINAIINDEHTKNS